LGENIIRLGGQNFHGRRKNRGTYPSEKGGRPLDKRQKLLQTDVRGGERRCLMMGRIPIAEKETSPGKWQRRRFWIEAE